MNNIFDNEEKGLITEDEFVEADELMLVNNYSHNSKNRSSLDARRQLDGILEERRLRSELEDFADY
jgi:RNase adaptor protein for sRNA GlmZ degradation